MGFDHLGLFITRAGKFFSREFLHRICNCSLHRQISFGNANRACQQGEGWQWETQHISRQTAVTTPQSQFLVSNNAEGIFNWILVFSLAFSSSSA